MSQPFPAACLYLTGPTASGKTAVGIELAKLVGGEIVALDSMTLYRGMDVGTAKPTAEERAAVPHHLLDVLDPHEEFSQAEYAVAALRIVQDIMARGKVPLFVGGTPLYLKTLLRGMFEGPAANWEFRTRIEQEARSHEPNWLHQLLGAVDSKAAAKLHPNDTRRIIRALEVFEETGKAASTFQLQFEKPRHEADGRVFVLDWPRERLYQRIEQRVDLMLSQGLVDEVRTLSMRPQGLSRTAGQALGYREVLEHLEGRSDWVTMVEAIKAHTRQFAKRQLTWFRSLAECRWIAMSGEPDARETARTIAEQIRRDGLI
jgi:tRNA dimethylallyltransferase